MGLEPGSGRDGVVVADDEHAVVGIGAERVDSRVERVASVQPPDPGLMAIRAAAKVLALVPRLPYQFIFLLEPSTRG